MRPVWPAWSALARSAQLLSRLRPLRDEPIGQLVGLASPRGVEGSLLVMSDPIAIGPAGEQVFCRGALSAVTGAPQRVRDVFRCRPCLACEFLCDSIHQSQC